MTDNTPETEVVQPTETPEAAPTASAKKPRKPKADAALAARVQTLEEELAAAKEQYQRMLAE